MAACDKLPSKKRLQYTREEVLAAKDGSDKLDTTELYENIARAKNAMQRNRGKTKQSPVSRSANGETKPIFLGPQNRNWNAGCHVNRDYADVCGRGKFSSDNHERNGRIGDRRDSRGGHAGFRDRGFIRKDRSFGKQNEQRDEQPEWFVDGPSTINDTIELGDVIEYDRRKDGEGPTKMKASGDCDESKKSNSPKVIQHTLSDLEGDIKALSVDEDIGKKAASSEKNQGSRLKHLFAMADADNSSKCDSNVNDQLLQLLKGTQNANSVTKPSVRNNVAEVESKLRSMLLVSSSVKDTSDSTLKTIRNKVPKHSALTVEEIESQISSHSNDAAGKPIKDNHGNSEGSSSDTSRTNWAPFLRSLLNNLRTTAPSPAVVNINNSQATHNYASAPQATHFPPPGLGDDSSNSQNLLRQLWEVDKSVSVSGGVRRTMIPSAGSQQINASGPFQHNVPLNDPRSCGQTVGAYPITGRNMAASGASNLAMSSGFNLLQPTASRTQSVRPDLLNFGANQQYHQRFNCSPVDLLDRSSVEITSRQPCGEQFHCPSNQLPPNNYPFPHSIRGMQNSGQAESALAFISHLSEMDRKAASAACSRVSTSYASRLPMGNRVPTVEEIEHQDMSRESLYNF